MGAPLSAEEKARRAVALTVAEAAPLPAFEPIKPYQIGDRIATGGTVHEVVADLTEDGLVAGIVPALPQPRRRIQDHPVVTVTITGAPSSGKSVIAHLIRNALAYEGIATSGPDELRSIAWRRAVQDLIARGIRVVLEARETGDA